MRVVNKASQGFQPQRRGAVTIQTLVKDDVAVGGVDRGARVRVHVVAGARLGCELAVAVDVGTGETQLQQQAEPVQRLLLRVGARVGGYHVFTEAAYVDHAHAERVVAQAVGALHLKRTAALNGAVLVDDVVIAALTEAAGTVPTVKRRLVNMHRRRRRRAVDDDFIDCSHGRFVSLQGLEDVGEGSQGGHDDALGNERAPLARLLFAGAEGQLADGGVARQGVLLNVVAHIVVSLGNEAVGAALQLHLYGGAGARQAVGATLFEGARLALAGDDGC